MVRVRSRTLIDATGIQRPTKSRIDDIFDTACCTAAGQGIYLRFGTESPQRRACSKSHNHTEACGRKRYCRCGRKWAASTRGSSATSAAGRSRWAAGWTRWTAARRPRRWWSAEPDDNRRRWQIRISECESRSVSGCRRSRRVYQPGVWPAYVERKRDTDHSDRRTACDRTHHSTGANGNDCGKDHRRTR